jgi:hypothetical protein
MLSAAEAKQKAEAIKLSETNGILAKVSQAIDAAVSRGEFSIQYGEYLNKDLCGALRKKGYTVTPTSDQRDGSYTTISWRSLDQTRKYRVLVR